MANRSKRIADKLRERIDAQAAQVAGFFHEEAAQAPRGPTPRQRAAKFIQMTQEEKQQLFLETEPGQWGNFVQKEMDNAIDHFGPAVAQAYPFFASGLPPQTTPEEDTPEGELARLEEALGVSLGL
jgi:hypothetical protein